MGPIFWENLSGHTFMPCLIIDAKILLLLLNTCNYYHEYYFCCRRTMTLNNKFEETDLAHVPLSPHHFLRPPQAPLMKPLDNTAYIPSALPRNKG